MQCEQCGKVNCPGHYKKELPKQLDKPAPIPSILIDEEVKLILFKRFLLGPLLAKLSASLFIAQVRGQLVPVNINLLPRNFNLHHLLECDLPRHFLLLAVDDLLFV